MLKKATVLVGFLILAAHGQAHSSDCAGVLTKSDKARWLQADDDHLRIACFSRPDVKAPDIDSLTQNGHSVGLYFHQNLSMDQRKHIIDDLLWLSQRREEIHTQLLSDVLGIEGSVTGPKVLAWFLDRVAVISNAVITPEPIVITPFVVGDRYLAFQAKPYVTTGKLMVWRLPDREDQGDYGGVTSNVMSVGDADRGETRSFRFGDVLTLPVLRGAWREHQSIQIGRVTWASAHADTPVHKVARLIVYLHEAAHVGSARTHVTCADDDPKGPLRERYGCDETFLSPYGLSYAFADSLSKSGDLSNEGSAWAAAVAKKMLAHVKSHRYEAAPPRPISTSASLDWLQAAALAYYNGYNVRLRHVVSCKKFAGGCGRKDLESAIRKMRKWPNERGFRSSPDIGLSPNTPPS